MPGINSSAAKRAIRRTGQTFDVTTTTTEREEVEGDFDDVDETTETFEVKGFANRPSPAERERTAVSDGPSVDMSVTIGDDPEGTVSDGDEPGVSPSIMAVNGIQYRVVNVHPNADGTLAVELTRV